MAQRKGFKVTDSERKVRVGIAVENLEELRKKTINKFKLSGTDTDVIFQTRDGLFIRTDEEFNTLPPQTLLIWVRNGQRAQTDAEILYRTIREVNFDFLNTGEKVQEFFTEQMKNKVYTLAKVLKEVDEDRTLMSSKEDDPDWFQGVASRSKTKEEYMFRRSQDRIKKYYYATKDDLLKNRNLPANDVHALCIELNSALKDSQYFGCYFDRRLSDAMCNWQGSFQCQGRWDKDACLHLGVHVINPYRSYEERIIFQTWNLDHRIERSRSIIPSIVHAVSNIRTDGRSHLEKYLDIKQIFADLFRSENLQIVHIVCHDKGAHSEPNLMRYVIKT